jgi:AAA15 family ATPase/GTPase
MFVLILVVLLYVFIDFDGTTKINTNMQKTYQNQHKHTKDTPKSTQTYKRPTKINTNMQKNHQNQQKHTKEPPDFDGSFVCLC